MLYLFISHTIGPVYRPHLSPVPHFKTVQVFRSSHKNATFVARCKGKGCPLHAKQARSEYTSTLPTIDTGAKSGWVAGATPGEVKEYPGGSVRLGSGPDRTEYLALTVRRTPDRTAPSESLCRLSYPGRLNAAE
jgi:hypothetical protein